MYIIGLCGRSGSGKTLVCSILAKRGVFTIDSDKICRQLYRENKDCIFELAERFGRDIVSENGINRALLAKRAFANEQNLKDLNCISHKYIISEILNEVNSASVNGKKYAVVDAPLLFEAGLDKHCDAIISVFSKKSIMYSRLKEREDITVSAFKKRIDAQKTNLFLLNNSDAVINNTGSKKDLKIKTNRAMMLIQFKLGVLKSRGECKRYVHKKQ